MQTHTRSADLVDAAQMEGCLEAPAHPGYAVRARRIVAAAFDGTVFRRCCRSFRAADTSTPNAAVCPAAPRIYIGMIVSPIGPARLPLGGPHRDYGSLLRPPKGFRRSGPHTDRARRSCAMRFTRILCLNLSFSFHGSVQDFSISFIWRALLCLEGLTE